MVRVRHRSSSARSGSAPIVAMRGVAFSAGRSSTAMTMAVASNMPAASATPAIFALRLIPSLPFRPMPGRVRSVAAARHEAAELLASLRFGGGVAGGFERLSASLRSDQCREVRDLLGLQGEKLVAGLRRLQRSGRRLAGADDVRHGGARAVDIADHASLDLQRILEPGDAGLPAVLRAVDQRLVGGVEVHVAVAGRKRLLDLLDVIGDALRLPEKLLGLTTLRLKLLERGKWQAGEVFSFVDQRAEKQRSVVKGKSGSGRVDIGGSRNIKKKKH